jgi:predicted O-methyltransferase YrrM
MEADMVRDEDSDRAFQAAVQRLRVPGMGTDVVAPLLSHLVHLVRPRRVLEVGMGYTTPFLAKALAEIEAQVEAEAAALVGKSAPYLAAGREFDEDWITAEPALLVPAYYRSDYRPLFAAVDDFSMEDSSVGRVQAVLTELGLADRVTIVNAELRKCRDLLPAGLVPIDFAWVDAWDCLYFFEHFWELINPDGGLVVMHYLMTYPEGEAILEYIAETQRLRPGEFEVLNLLESQKIRQNSLTVLRRTGGLTPKQYSDTGLRARLGGPLRADAVALASSADPAGPAAHGPANGAQHGLAGGSVNGGSVNGATPQPAG